MSAPVQSDVAIIGGGIMGASAAFFLRRHGLSVTLLETDKVGRQASGTNFGNVRRQGRPIFQLPLANRASRIWRTARELLGSDVEYLQSGHMRVCFSDRPENVGAMEDYATKAREEGLDLEILTGNTLRARFPWLGPEVLAGSHSAMDGHANPRLAAPAFARAAIAAGAQVFEDTRITGAAKIGDDFELEADDGRLFRAPVLLVTAGAWAGKIATQFGEDFAITPRAPTMSVTEPVPYAIEPSLGVMTALEVETVYFRQVERGNIVIGGSTRAPSYPDEYRSYVLPESTMTQFEHIRRLAPVLANLSIIRVWTGIEGYMDDSLPVMGPSSNVPGLYHAFGFSGAGFQLGPGVGETMAELIATGATDIPLAPYSPDRFGK
ncbi:NAD(P)/FAD-dependent oxidoreductase [Croceicoccus bisphenolivorans]|uniref:NAD(P)/FAD-dependent oxidoreductase n=1 Tax=Croceicoccus bisphenolivorans TaxID=1783232 RepID=UPI0008348CAF|nr:FAD-binding oxidoreductase [Croceicoccus bisphenolivorans]